MAATHYVVTNGTPGVTSTDPYTNWATAGTSILEVVNAAMTNTGTRVVWVTNGTYYFTRGVDITNSLTIQSVNGRSNTIINGNRPAMSNYAFYINCSAGSTGVMDGITITNFVYTNYATVYINNRGTIKNCLITDNLGRTPNGASSGGGIFMNYDGEVTNCVVRANSVNSYGGGIAVADANNTVRDTLIQSNIVDSWGGGGIALFGSAAGAGHGNNCVISNCIIINNRACSGGGIGSVGTATNWSIISCVITGNTAAGRGAVVPGLGGGIKMFGTAASYPFIKNCTIQGNLARDFGGGIYGMDFSLRNSLISGNTAQTNGGGAWVQTGLVENCTIVSNVAGTVGGGLYFDGLNVTGINNIVYYNTAASANNFTNTAGNTGLHYSCVIPAVNGTGNITNNPVLKDLAGGDYRLRMTSPCVNAGTNQDWMTGAVDLDGNARILKTIVDMGAYETRIWQGTIYRIP